VGGAVTRTYAYGLERISENQQISAAWTPSFYGYDGHGSVRQLTDATGAVTDTYDYDAFGTLTNSTGSTPNNYLFAGEQYDPALSLYYNRARYLNTATGRFWSMDTVEGTDDSPLSLHKYLYAANDSTDRVDPSGNNWWTSIKRGIEVHKLLYADFLLKVRTGVANVSVKTILGLSGPTQTFIDFGLYARPDLVNPLYAPGVGLIYEIKPNNAVQIYLGGLQLAGYLSLLTSYDPLHRFWVPGDTINGYQPRTPLTLSDGATVDVSPPAFGLILYTIRSTNDPNDNEGPANPNLVVTPQQILQIGTILTAGLIVVAGLIGARGPAGAFF
jgi:RHS repeat-associated protein